MDDGKHEPGFGEERLDESWRKILFRPGDVNSHSLLLEGLFPLREEAG